MARTLAIVCLFVAGLFVGGHAQSQNPLGFVPGGCQGLTVAAMGHRDSSGKTLSGVVLLQNPNTFDIPIKQVQVMIANNVPVAPMYVTAQCPDTSVDASPIPYQLGELSCSWRAQLPQSGPAANGAAWTAIQATATINMSNAKCQSSIAPITTPLLMG